MYIYQLLFGTNGQATREGLLNVIAFLIVLVFTIVLHELAHGWSAYAFGDTTAKDSGRLTINPVKHFDLYGFLMMVLVGFGWARPVPVNPYNLKKQRLGMAVVAVAGVLTNLILALFGALFLRIVVVNAVALRQTNYYLYHFLYMFFSMTCSLNISFALFNILPLFPLDGYRLLSSFVRQENSFMTFLRRYSLYILLFLLVLNYIPVVRAYSPLNLWISVVGSYIYNGFFSFWSLII